MNNSQTDSADRLQALVKMEVSDIVATANEEGFSAKDALAALSLAVSASAAALEQDPDPAEDPATLI
ncbi:MAG: hypothetical protein KL863_14405 [Rhizobium sp.]|nr:hypothetical protein [Rhizobium sp.]